MILEWFWDDLGIRLGRFLHCFYDDSGMLCGWLAGWLAGWLTALDKNLYFTCQRNDDLATIRRYFCNVLTNFCKSLA